MGKGLPYQIVGEGHCANVMSKRKSQPGKEPEENIPDRGNSKCRGQEVRRVWHVGRKERRLYGCIRVSKRGGSR